MEVLSYTSKVTFNLPYNTIRLFEGNPRVKRNFKDFKGKVFKERKEEGMRADAKYLDFALQRGQIGAFLWICWWQERQDFMGGGCCW